MRNPRAHRLGILIALALFALMPSALYFVLATIWRGRHGGIYESIGLVLFPFMMFSPFLALGFVVATFIVAWWCFRSRSQFSVLALCLCLVAAGLYVFMAYDFERSLERIGGLQGGDVTTP